MASIFSQILNMSMTGSVVIVLVMLARLVLKRSPKIFSYVLWSVVLFRLLCPVAFTAPISVLDVVEPEQKETSNNTSIVTFIPATVNTQADFIMVQPEEQQVQVESVTEPEEQLQMTPMHAVALVWSAGMAGMMLYSVVQYLGLRRRLVGSVKLNGNIYLADHIDTAFVVGLVQPRIYLPSAVTHKERYFILAHEQHHIRRGDHIIKLLAYLALCIHWFNPLVWLAFILAGKDMEMSCDEAVIKKLGADIRADYSASLLRLATHKKILSGMPLAFGEGDTKGRVLNMAKWKKPTKWVVAICVILCLCIVVVCAFNPEEEIPIEELTRRTSEGPVDTAIGDLCFIYPGGLTSEQRDVDNWSDEDTTRSRRDLPTRRPYSHFFIDNGVDFGGIVDFIVPEDQEIRLEEMNLPTEWVGLDYIGGSSSYPYAEMEYTLIKDGKDYIQMYQYTYSGRGYFLWFYTEQGNPAHKETILNSVELGSFSTTTTKLKRDEIISLGQFNITIPKGYGYHRQEDKILEITKKERFGEHDVIGCVTASPNPNLSMENEADLIRWIEAVGVDLSGEGIFSEIADESEYGDVSLKIHNLSDLPPMDEEHYLFIAGDIVYDLWIDPAKIEESTKTSILKSIWIKDILTVSKNASLQSDSPIISSVVRTDIEVVQYGILEMVLPSGLKKSDENGIIVLKMDDKTVGGIALRHQNQTNSPNSFSTDWMSEIGVPEANNTAMGYMSSSSEYADYEITYFPDIPVNRDENGNIIPDEQGTYVLEHEVTHYFFVDSTDVYDIWFYNNRIPNIMRETVLKTCYLDGITDIAAMQTALNEEIEALQQCHAVLETIQSNGACKIETKQENGPSALNETTLRTDWIHGSDRLINCLIPESGGASMFGGLLVDGAKYECDSAQQWREIADWEYTDPWLASFKWDESFVAYMDTLTDESGITVMLRIDQPFSEGEDQQPHYFVNFKFDVDDTFRNVYVQTNLFMNNAISKTESVVSLDAELIKAEIQKEYQKAIG